MSDYTEYPKSVYHRNGKSRVVSDEEQERAAKKDGYGEHPGTAAPVEPKIGPKD